MADYSMEDEKWNKNKSKVQAYMETHDLGDMAAVINWNLTQGDNDPINRKRFWSSITTLFGMLEDSPISRGRESNLPDEVQNLINTYCSTFAAAHRVLFATDLLFGELIRKHGKSGGGVYENADEYATGQSKSMRMKLTRYYRNHLKGITTEPSWDGTQNNGVPNIVSPVQSEAEEEE
jgi:hypothetical protein